MKIVQTSWSATNNDIFNFNAGWLSPEYHLMAWSLSCLQLRKFYDEVVLHADSVTSKVLIDILQLPYSEVICDLDQFHDIPPQLFALPKIHTYAKQTVPFLHVDGDVFIWKPFDRTLLQSSLIAQNLEVGTSYYARAFDQIERELIYFPDEILEEKQKNEKIYAYNAGIIGGSDLSFFNLFTERARETISKNNECLSKIQIETFNIYFEQFLFYCMAGKSGKKVNVMFDYVFPDNGYIHFGGFIDVPYQKQYLHLVGRHKKSKRACEEMANRLRQDYPEYYYKIIALFKNKNIPLKSDYYNFINHPSSQFLLDRYLKLKRHNKNNFPAIIEEGAKLYELPDLSIGIVNKLEHLFEKKGNSQQDADRRGKMLTDATTFEKELRNVVQNKFFKYSTEHLYARDIQYTQYFEYLFADMKSCFSKIIQADPIVEQIISEYDWTALDNIAEGDAGNLLNPNNVPAEIINCVVPECCRKRYSLIKIDDLDLELLKQLEYPISIGDLLTIMRSVLELTDSDEALEDFDNLVLGRIKLALQAKIIKVVI